MPRRIRSPVPMMATIIVDMTSEATTRPTKMTATGVGLIYTCSKVPDWASSARPLLMLLSTTTAKNHMR
jgi:hypothetical protein